MNPELIQQLNEQLDLMNELVGAQNAAIVSQLKATMDSSNSVKNKIVSEQNSVQVKRASDYAMTGNIKKTEALTKANALADSSTQQFSISVKQSKNAALDFAEAVISATPGVSKYSSGMKGLTTSASGILSTFGPLGKMIGVLVGAIGQVASSSFKYLDNVSAAHDSIAKSGASIGTSAEGLIKLGRNANLSSQTLELMAKGVKELDSSILNLGNTASQGVQTFGRVIAVGDKNLQRYRNLGYTQEDLIEAQTNYLKLQSQTGAIMKDSPDKLQKASLGYIDELNAMAEVTGISAKKQQDLLEQAQAQENFNAHIADLERDKAKATSDAEKDQIQKVIDAKKQYATFAQSLDPNTAKALLETISTKGDPVITDANAQLRRVAPEVFNQAKKLNQGLDQRAALASTTVKMVRRFENQYGELGTATGESARNLQQLNMVGNNAREFAARFGNKTEDQINSELAQSRKELNDKKNETQGAVADRGKIESQERNLRLTYDIILADVSNKLMSMVLTFIPMVTTSLGFINNNMPAIETGIKVLGISLAVLAGAAGVGKLFQAGKSLKDTVFGLFSKSAGEIGSSPNNAMYIKLAKGGDTLEKVSGSHMPATSKRDSGFSSADASKSSINSKLAKTGDELGKISGSSDAHMPVKANDGNNTITTGMLKQNSSGQWIHTTNRRKGQHASKKEIAAHTEGTIDHGGRPLHSTDREERLRNLSVDHNEITEPDPKSGFLTEVVSALKKAGKSAPMIIAGAGALAAAIAELGAGIAGATWIMGKALPTFADGMKSFNEVNGENLKGVGIGLTGLGVGMLSIGAAKVTEAVGNIIKYFTGGEDPLTEALRVLKEMQSWKLDRKKVEDNGAALLAYAKTIAAISAVSAGESIVGAVKSYADGVAAYFKSTTSYEDFENFAKLDIDPTKIKINSNALADFGNAISSFKGSSPGARSAVIAEAVTNFFGNTPPYIKLFVFGALSIDVKNVQQNATAFKQFSEAMSSYKGYGSNTGAIGSAIADAVSGFFNVNPPYAKLLEFGKQQLNVASIKANAEAFTLFSDVISKYTGMGDNSGASGTAIAEATSKFFGSTPPFESLRQFGEIKINSKKVKNNAKAFKNFAEALASYKGFGSSVSMFATVIADASVKFFGVKPPLSQFVDFSHLNINQKKTKTNAISFVWFSQAMASYSGGDGLTTAVSTIAGAKLNELFGQDSAVDAFYNFSKLDFGQNADKNAMAFLDFSKAMGILSGGSSSSGGPGILGTLGTVAGTAIGTAVGIGKQAWEGISSLGGTIGGILQKIIHVESGGNASAQAKTSSAFGLGQFTKGTFEGIAKQKGSPVFGATWEQYKSDPKIQMAALSYLVNQNIDFLNSNKIPVSATSVYLSHFLGQGGVRNVYRHSNQTPIDQAVSSAAYHANKSVFSKAGTVGGLKEWAGKKMGDPMNVAQARKGGLFSGPTGGYPMIMHGTEIIIPSVPNSLLTQLATENAENTENLLSSVITNRTTSSMTSTDDGLDITKVIQTDIDLREMMLAKLNKVLHIAKDNTDTSEKLLRHARA